MREASLDMLKALVEVRIRCGEHETFESGCINCCFLRKAEHDLEALKTRRNSIVQQIMQRLRTRNLAAIDLR